MRTAKSLVKGSAFLVLCVILSRPAAAARWLLVDFHDSDTTSTFGAQFPTWNTIIRDTAHTAYVDPDGDPNHAGVAEVGVSPGNDITYYGIQGTIPIDFQPPHQIVATSQRRT